MDKNINSGISKGQINFVETYETVRLYEVKIVYGYIFVPYSIHFGNEKET